MSRRATILVSLLFLSTALCIDTDIDLIDHGPCVLPKFPQNGKYVIAGEKNQPNPGEKVRPWARLNYKCDDDFELSAPENYVLCVGGEWTRDLYCYKRIYKECSDIQNGTSGVYLIQLDNVAKPFLAYCDLDFAGGKWTVFQSRFDGSVDFYRDYQAYTEGFGSPNGEHWLGLENIHQLTKDHNHELYIELKFMNGDESIGRYNDFYIGDQESGYTLNYSGYNGNEMGDHLRMNNGHKFSTKDKDQDNKTDKHCAENTKGGWWHSTCTNSNLNGVYNANEEMESVYWGFRGFLKRVRMLTRKKGAANKSVTPEPLHEVEDQTIPSKSYKNFEDVTAYKQWFEV